MTNAKNSVFSLIELHAVVALIGAPTGRLLRTMQATRNTNRRMHGNLTYSGFLLKPLRGSLLVIALLSCEIANGDDGSVVYGFLADLQASSDQLTRAGYACLAKGVKRHSPSRVNDFEGTSRPTLAVTCRRGNQAFYAQAYKIDAAGFAFTPETHDILPRLAPRVIWQWEAVDANRVRAQRRLKTPIIEDSLRQFTRDKRFHVKKHDPLQDYLYPSLIDYPGLPTSEIAKFVANAELVDTKELGSGYVQAEFQIKYPNTVHGYQIRFSRAHGGMPTEVRVFYAEKPLVEGSEIICAGKYSWVKHDKLWLPDRVEYVKAWASGDFSEGEFELNWKRGRQVRKSVFDFENPNPIRTLVDMFELSDEWAFNVEEEK